MAYSAYICSATPFDNINCGGGVAEKSSAACNTDGKISISASISNSFHSSITGHASMSKHIFLVQNQFS
jgi:hypothetical protein